MWFVGLCKFFFFGGILRRDAVEQQSYTDWFQEALLRIGNGKHSHDGCMGSRVAFSLPMVSTLLGPLRSLRAPGSGSLLYERVALGQVRRPFVHESSFEFVEQLAPALEI